MSGVGSTASVASLPELALDPIGSDRHPRWPTATSSDPARPIAAGHGLSPDTSTAVDRLRADLDAHGAGDGRESLSMAIMAAELDRLPRPFDEDDDLTHVTSSGIAVGPRGVVLHRHRRLHRWIQPGGHIEPGETPEQAVIRECVEETGLEVAHLEDGPTLIHVDVHSAAGQHVHLDLRYLVLAPDAEPSPAAGESQDVAWFTWEAARSMADEALAGALVAARSLIVASGVRMTGREGEE